MACAASLLLQAAELLDSEVPQVPTTTAVAASSPTTSLTTAASQFDLPPHNSVEKRRRAYLTACFRGLQDAVPSVQALRASNVNVLRSAAAFIMDLRREDQRLVDEIARLKREQALLLEKRKNAKAVKVNDATVPTAGASSSEDEDSDDDYSDYTEPSPRITTAHPSLKTISPERSTAEMSDAMSLFLLADLMRSRAASSSPSSAQHSKAAEVLAESPMAGTLKRRRAVQP